MHAKHERCSSEDVGGHPAPPKVTEVHSETKPGSELTEGSALGVSSLETRSNWSPGKYRKIYYSYFEREDDDIDNNDK